MGRCRQTQRFALGLLTSADQVDGLLALGHLDLPRGEDLFFRCHCGGACRVCCGLGHALGLAFASHGNGALLFGQLDCHTAFNLQRLDGALFANALLLDALLGTDARFVDDLLGLNLRPLCRLLALGPLGAHLRTLPSAGDLYFSLLRKARIFALTVDV